MNNVVAPLIPGGFSHMKMTGGARRKFSILEGNIKASSGNPINETSLLSFNCRKEALLLSLFNLRKIDSFFLLGQLWRCLACTLIVLLPSKMTSMRIAIFIEIKMHLLPFL